MMVTSNPTWGLLPILEVLRKAYIVQGIEPRPTVCNGSTLPALLSTLHLSKPPEMGPASRPLHSCRMWFILLCSLYS